MKKGRVVILAFPTPKFTIGCDYAIPGEDRSVECFVKIDGAKGAFEYLMGYDINNDLIFKDKQKQTSNKMKITEKTTIGEMIPEGWELDASIITTTYEDSSYGLIDAQLNFKKKEVKDFKWYVKKYFSELSDCEIISGHSTYTTAIFQNDYNTIPFEFKVGLLRFICDDLDQDFWLNIKYISKRIDNLETLALSKICPSEFLN